MYTLWHLFIIWHLLILLTSSAHDRQIVMFNVFLLLTFQLLKSAEKQWNYGESVRVSNAVVNCSMAAWSTHPRVWRRLVRPPTVTHAIDRYISKYAKYRRRHPFMSASRAVVVASLLLQLDKLLSPNRLRCASRDYEHKIKTVVRRTSAGADRVTGQSGVNQDGAIKRKPWTQHPSIHGGPKNGAFKQLGQKLTDFSNFWYTESRRNVNFWLRY